MRVGIIGGTGPLGRGLAMRLGAAGVEVVLGSREASRAAEVAGELGEAIRTAISAAKRLPEGAANEGAAACDLVIVATPWDAAVATVAPLAGILSGKVVISVANALVRQGREMQALFPSRGSIAAAVQASLPSSMVAAACQHLPAGDLADLSLTLDADVLVCSDHPAAVTAASELLGHIEGLRPLDAGRLASAAPIEAFTAVLVSLNIRYKAHATLRLGGIDTQPSEAKGTGRGSGPADGAGSR